MYQKSLTTTTARPVSATDKSADVAALKSTDSVYLALRYQVAAKRRLINPLTAKQRRNSIRWLIYSYKNKKENATSYLCR